MTDRIYLSAPDVGALEREYLLDAFDSNWIAPLGPHVDALEGELATATGRRHCAALSSGTAGLHLALLGVGAKPGDIVLTSTQTFCATANAVTYLGAKPAFVDSSAATWTMDPDLLDKGLTALATEGQRVAAVVPVDLYGQMADYAEITRVCMEHEVPLISDAAESLGAAGKAGRAGQPGHAAIVSFNGNKIITGSTGGAVVSDDGDFIDRARYLSTQARQPVAHYEHTDIGFNYRMSNLVAAVVRGQLASLDAKVARRAMIRRKYEERLAEFDEVSFMPMAPYGDPNHWLTCIRLSGGASARDAFLASLASENIEARPTWKPMHLQPVFSGARAFGGSISEQIFDEGVCLPSGSGMTDAQLDRVITTIVHHLKSTQ